MSIVVTPGQDPSLKSLLRKRIRAVIAAISSTQRREYDLALYERLAALSVLDAATMVAGYYPLADEIALVPLLQRFLEQGKSLGLPRVERLAGAPSMTMHQVNNLDTDLQDTDLVCRVPDARLPLLSLESRSVILVPGRAFTSLGARLGRGGGYYDAFLATSPGIRVALAYDEQVVDFIPLDPHDIFIDILITPSRTEAIHRA